MNFSASAVVGLAFVLLFTVEHEESVILKTISIVAAILKRRELAHAAFIINLQSDSSVIGEKGL
jgi:hypothetical protein